jgi:hypothetical protein
VTRKSTSRKNRKFLDANASKALKEDAPKVLLNRQELRDRGVNLTRRTGKPHARLKKARAAHKPQEES